MDGAGVNINRTKNTIKNPCIQDHAKRKTKSMKNGNYRKNGKETKSIRNGMPPLRVHAGRKYQENPRFFEVFTEKQKTRKVEFLERMVKQHRESREGVLGKKAP